MEHALLIKEDDLEILLRDLLEVHGYDFTNYARASLKRRINRLASMDRIPSFAELRYRVKNNKDYLQRFVEEITVNVNEMFRDPVFFEALRTIVFPQLATKPFIRIWHAGCSTGEEVYSMAILLKEANLLDRSLLYATDLNPSVLEVLKKGIYPLQTMKQNSENYIRAGGRFSFSDYYSALYDWAMFDASLRNKMIISTHNLVSDRSFNEFQLILCRNVLIYFDKDLQNKVLTLFDQSLENLGFLALGSKESIRFSPIKDKYQQVSSNQKIWRKMQ